jgi:hypothetical protein
LTAERLASAISTILTDPRFRKTAAELGEKIRQEQGVRQARLLIEQLVHKIGLRKGEVAQRLSREARARKERVTRRKEVQQGWRSRKADVQKSAR